MDWTAILTFIGGGGLATIFFMPLKRKALEIENESKSSKQWMELYEKVRTEKDQINKLVDKLYDDIKDARNEINDLTTENALLKAFKCERMDCAKRVPPLGKEGGCSNE